MIGGLIEMKKLLTMMLILALSVSCLIGCGSSEPTETETTSKEETQQTEETSTETEVVESETEEVDTEEATEETSEEVAEPEMEQATAVVADEDGSVKIEITYNATVFELDAEHSDQLDFHVKEFDENLSFQYEDAGLPVPTEYEVWMNEVYTPIGIKCKANITAEEFVDWWSETDDENQYFSNFQSTTYDGVYSVDYTFFGDTTTYYLYELEGNVISFMGGVYDPANTETLVNLFLIDAKVVE